MPPSPDHQLGSNLRLRRPAGAANRQQLQGMLRDLVGGDESLLPPLQHLIARPAFLALDPQTTSPAQRLLGRDQLLGELADLYQPRVVERLRAFLDGYLDLDCAAPAPAAPAPRIWGEVPPAAVSAPSAPPHVSGTPEPGSPPASPPGVSSAGAAWGAAASPAAPASPATAMGWGAAGSGGSAPFPGAAAIGMAPTAPAATAAAPDPAPESGVEHARRQTRSGRPLPWILGLMVLAGLGIGLGSRLPAICRPLGLCPAAPAGSPAEATASSQTLERAQQAASALERAGTLEALEAALSELERDLLRLSGDPLSPGQLRRREQLQAAASDGRQRLAEERQHAQTVAQAAGRIDALASLSASQQASERQSLSQMLEAIPAHSLSHGAASQQLKRLKAQPAAPSEDASPQAAPGDPGTSGMPATPPPPVGDPGWRSTPAGQGNAQGSSAAPGASAPPARQPAEESGSNAPYREDPLF